MMVGVEMPWGQGWEPRREYNEVQSQGEYKGTYRYGMTAVRHDMVMASHIDGPSMQDAITVSCLTAVVPYLCIPLCSPDSGFHCIPFSVPILVLMALPLPPSYHCHYIVFWIWRSAGSCSFRVTIIVTRLCGLVHYFVFHSPGNWKLVYR